MKILRLAACLALLLIGACSLPSARPPKESKLLIFGASGRIGGELVTEAQLRGYSITGVTRDPSSLEGKFEGLSIVEGDILNRAQLKELVGQHDAVLVSVGGKPSSNNPRDYIAASAAQALIDVLEPLGNAGPRVIFVGNLYTLKTAQGQTLIELGRAAGHPNEAMFRGHQIALERFRNSTHIRWTVASPPNGLRLVGRSGKIRWSQDTLIVDADGKPLSISPQDFAFAILQELQQGQYLKRRFTVAADL